MPLCVPGMCWAPRKCCANGTQRAVAWAPPRNACHQGRRASVAVAASLQSCPTLCDPVDCSLPGFSVHGILQARTLDMLGASSKPCFPVWRSVGVCGGGEVGPLYPQGLCYLLPADLLCGHWKLPTSLTWGGSAGATVGKDAFCFPVLAPDFLGRAKIADCPFQLLSFFHDNRTQLLTGHSSQHTLLPSLLCCDIWLRD